VKGDKLILDGFESPPFSLVIHARLAFSEYPERTCFELREDVTQRDVFVGVSRPPRLAVP
jgi:hypothetical protein